MVALVGAAMSFGYVGLVAEPGSGTWWLARLPWIAVLLAVLLVFIAVFGRFEQLSTRKSAGAVPSWRVVAGSILLTVRLALMATGGISDDGPLGLRVEAVLPALTGALLVLLRFASRERRS